MVLKFNKCRLLFWKSRLTCTYVKQNSKWPLVTALLVYRCSFEYGQDLWIWPDSHSIRFTVYDSTKPDWRDKFSFWPWRIAISWRQPGSREWWRAIRAKKNRSQLMASKSRGTWSQEMSSANSSELGRGLQSFRCDQSSSCPCDFPAQRAWVEDGVNSYLTPDQWKPWQVSLCHF